ncbi:gliding motility-associated C-terminal domain-containing protein [Aurantibacillus circumpalustris]|uniref:T9SS type B sorting domain-containing protein n=1 Tax=Aurantibacillus circumpalustris TaxID=3036359 RepID=UPI00295B189E|nr:gliding motility-associated C-terminal domain-containing protein [Aurantibacillus circumpalustris]
MLKYLNTITTRFSGFICLACLLFVSNNFFSQNQDKKWYFGSAAGLDFTNNPVTQITSSSMSGYKEGTASVADAFGNLLFYTDGVTIWNKLDQIMANGTGLFGNVLTTQSALIVKRPGAANIYFVFTLGKSGSSSSFCYSTVDMNLAAGMGSVTTKNVLINAPMCEKLTGTKHCNGIDTWVVTHDYNSSVFRSVLVTSTGVSSSATLSPIGSQWNTSFQSYGSAKISQNGKRLACGVYYSNAPVGNFEIYDFDNATGLVSNQLSLSIPLTFPAQPVSSSQTPPPPPKLVPSPLVCFPYGCEFSPDGSKFYGSGAVDSVIYQWDLCAGSNTAISNSRYHISAFKISALQLAKDGKIYVARPGKQMLGVILSPNLPGAACNYVADGQSIAPAFCSYGLPNFISETPQLPFVYSVNGSVNCNEVNFTAPSPPTTTVTGCTSTGYNITSFKWFFGDPTSAALNTSTLSNPVHIYPGQGTYTISLVYTYNNFCGGVNTDTLKQEVKIGVLPLLSSAGFNVCSGNPIVLSAPVAQTYSWSTGSVSNSITVNPSSLTSYTVVGLDTNACPYKSIQTINVYTTPTLTIKGDTTLCPGYQIKLIASGANTYSWSTNQTNATIYPVQSANTTYTLWGNTNGCVVKKTITVRIKQPDLLVSPNRTVCPGTAVTLTVGGAVDYKWTGGSRETTLAITPTITTTYTVEGMDAKTCVGMDSVVITVQTKTPTTDFSYKTPVCEKSDNLITVTPNNFNPGGVYSSVKLQIDKVSGEIDMASAQSGTYLVNYSLAASGCTIAALSAATVEILSAPVLSLTPSATISPGTVITLEASGGSTYAWSPANYLSCVDCSNPIATPPETIKYCVIAELNSCLDSACVKLIITCDTDADYSFPNAFTPNGDGNNDQFCLQGWSFCMREFNILIFDKWGELVYESSDPSFCWDGIYKGSPLGAGVFVYVVKAKQFDSIILNKKGNISLIR